MKLEEAGSWSQEISQHDGERLMQTLSRVQSRGPNLPGTESESHLWGCSSGLVSQERKVS